MGSRCGRGPGWGPSDLGAQDGLSHGPGGRKKKGGWPRAPGEEGCRGLALLSGEPGKSSGAPHPVRTPGGPRYAGALCQAAWRERLWGAQSPHPRTHSRRACSVRPWELPAESLAAPAPSRLPPRKVGGDGVREWGARRPPVALWRSCSLPRLCLAQLFPRHPPARLGTKAWMSSSAL